MLVERSSSNATSAAAVGALPVVESADGCNEPLDSDAIGAADPDPVSDATGSLPDMLDVIPAPLASIASEDPALPLTSPPAGSPDAELEVVRLVPGSEPCPVDSPAPPPVAVS